MWEDESIVFCCVPGKGELKICICGYTGVVLLLLIPRSCIVAREVVARLSNNYV